MKTIVMLSLVAMVLSACEEQASFKFTCEDCVVEGPAGKDGTK